MAPCMTNNRRLALEYEELSAAQLSPIPKAKAMNAELHSLRRSRIITKFGHKDTFPPL